MYTKLLGIRCFFSFGFFALLAGYMLLDRTGMGLFAMAAIALHESGHLMLMRLCGAKISSVGFYPFGVRIEKRGLLSYGQEAAVYLGGVGMNALTALLCAPFSPLRGFALMNVAFLLFNLLPVGRLDGGVLLHLFFCRIGFFEQADTLRRAVGLLILLPLFAAALSLSARGNATLLVTVIYLTVTLLSA